MSKRHYVEKYVDVTIEVEEAAKELAKERGLRNSDTLGVGHVDLDAATLGVLRLSRRGATPADLLGMLVGLIGSDPLKREIDQALRNSARR